MLDLVRRVRAALARLTGFRRREPMSRRYDEEMRYHVDMHSARNVAAGMSPEDAQRVAHVAFGGRTRFGEEARDEVRSRALEELARDAHFALRVLRRNRAFAAAATLTLALGIGATTVIYSLTDHVVLRPLDYPNADQLVVVRENIEQFKEMPSLTANASHFLEWRTRCTTCGDVAALLPGQATLRGREDSRLIPAAAASANLLPMLGAHAQFGRLFNDAEDVDGAPHVVVLTNGFWRRQFGAAPNILGTTIGLYGTTFTVIGVLADGFHLPTGRELGSPFASDAEPDVIVPLALNQHQRTTPGEFNYSVIARVAPGATIDRTRAQLESIERELSTQNTDKLTFHTIVEPLQTYMVGSVARGLVLLLAAVGALLLIVCVNLASLLLARNAARAHESAVRMALGAGRGRLIRQALTESVMLAVAGGITGIILSRWGLAALLHFAPANLPRLGEITLDPRVLAVALIVTVVAGIAFGVMPALRFAHTNPGDVLKSAGARGTTAGRHTLRAREVLVVAQVALSALLLVATGLFLTSFVHVMHADKGFTVDRALAVDIAMPHNDFSMPAQRQQLLDEAMQRLGATPGVTAVAVASALPLEGDVQIDNLSFEHDTRPQGARPTASIRLVSPSYFDAMGTTMRHGRTFENADRARHVVVLSARAANVLWPGENPIGKRVWPGSNDTLSEVIGVVDDIRTASIEKEGTLVAYVPYWSRPPASATLVLRTTVDPASIANTVRTALHALAPSTPVSRIRTMREIVSAAVAQRRFQLLLLVLFALTALVTASVGIYGVVAHSMARRTTELGVRMALGARAGDVQRLVIREGLTPVIVGVAAGLGASLLLGGTLRALLYQTKAADPVTMSGVALLLVSVAALACWLPAWRTTRMDLVRALRSD